MHSLFPRIAIGHDNIPCACPTRSQSEVMMISAYDEVTQCATNLVMRQELQRKRRDRVGPSCNCLLERLNEDVSCLAIEKEFLPGMFEVNTEVFECAFWRVGVLGFDAFHLMIGQGWISAREL